MNPLDFLRKQANEYVELDMEKYFRCIKKLLDDPVMMRCNHCVDQFLDKMSKGTVDINHCLKFFTTLSNFYFMEKNQMNLKEVGFLEVISRVGETFQAEDQDFENVNTNNFDQKVAEVEQRHYEKKIVEALFP